MYQDRYRRKNKNKLASSHVLFRRAFRNESISIVAGHTAQASVVTTKDIVVGFKPALAAEEAGPAEQRISLRECVYSN